MDFSKDTLRKKYNSKQQRAAERGLEFTLTFSQYEAMYNKSNLRCDYTGMVMSLNQSADNYISLERLDSTKGYVPDNVCLIRKDVNKLKGVTTDLAEKGVKGNNKVDSILLHKMCQTVYNPVKIQQIKDKYKKLFDSVATNIDTTTNDETLTQGDDTPMTTETVQYVNPELYFTRAYHDFGSQVESFGGEFKMTYSEFKRLVDRKTCQLTKRPVEASSVRMWVVDKSTPVCKTNVMAVDIKVCAGLETFMLSSGLSLTELRNMCKNLIK